MFRFRYPCGLSSVLASLLLPLAGGASASPVISEIMFHPAGVAEAEAREWVEISNDGSTTDLSGYRFSKGISYTFPAGTLLPPGGVLVVAADPDRFREAYPLFTGQLIGGWSGQLSDRGESVQLDDASGTEVDEVEYADEGDWAVRARPVVDIYGFTGWVWDSPADGGGRTLERNRLYISGKQGQNWRTSASVGGTPGTAAPAPGTFVMVTDVRHLPVIPRSTEPVTIYARVVDDSEGTMLPQRTLFWRRDGTTQFNAVTMTEAWREPANVVGVEDLTVSATIPAQPNNAIIEYYIAVRGDMGETASWPAPARTTAPGVVPEVRSQAANALYQVDNTFNAATAWTPGSRPVYRMIMTAAERAQLRSIQTTNGLQQSDAAMNATFISQDGSGLETRFLCAVRNRGFGSRLGPPNNFHVSFRSDEPWKDRQALQLNCRYPHSQVLAANIFALGGIAEQSARPVQLVINGVNVAETSQRMFGSYARIETLNGEWVERHFPHDPEGNMYRLDDHAPNTAGIISGDLGSGEFRYEGTQPLAYADTFLKRTNEEINDWSDLINLCRVISAPVSVGTVGQPTISDADYPARVREVIDVEQWFTYLALDALVGNQEGGLPTGRADDCAIYRGVIDPRFVLIPHDFDTCFNLNNDDNQTTPSGRSIFSFHTGSASLLGLQRLFTHPDLVPVYYQKMLHLVNNVFTRQKLDPLVDELLGGWVSAAAVTSVKTYIDERRASVISQIPVTYSMTTNLTQGTTGYLESAAGAVTLSGTFNVAEARSLRINGQTVTLNYRSLGTAVAGTWSYAAAVNSGFLTKGVNRIVAEFFDGPQGTGKVVRQLQTDVLVPDNGAFNALQGVLSAVSVPHTVSLQSPASYVPGLPVLVRVDARLSDGSLERSEWNRTATLTGPPGLILSPSTVRLYNGSGSALVTVGSTAGGLTRTLVQAGGTANLPQALAPSWRFLDSGVEPAPEWFTQPTFDDSLWRSGPLQAGDGDGDERTRVNNVPVATSSRRAFYFRQVFQVENPGTIAALRLRAVVDDGAVFYLNGTEVARDNLPSGPLAITTSASANRAGGEETTVRIFDISAFAHLIQPGPNLLAVQVHNFGSGNSDLSFDCGLEALSPVADPGNFTLSATIEGRTVSRALTSTGAAVPVTVSGILPSGETVWSGLVRVTGDLTVPADGTLRLAPGTIVLLDGNATPGSTAGADLIIAGRLLSQGTVENPVTLTCSDPANRWGELLFQNAAQPGLLQHTYLTRGGRSPGRGHTGKGPLIRLAGSQLTMEDCALGDSPAKAIYTSGPGSLSINRSLIARTITGPELEDGCSLLLEDSNIQEILPIYRESDSPAPDDEDCLYVHNNAGLPIIVRRSVLARCGDDIFDGLGGPLTVEDSILREGWDKGMSLLNNDLTISRTLIVDCDKAIVPKSSTVATRTVTANHVTIISEDHDTTLPPWGYTIPPSNPDPDTPSTGFYTQNKAGQSAPGAVLAINAKNSLIYAKEPIKVDPLYPNSNTVVTYSNLVDEDQPEAAPWPGTGNLAMPPKLENQGARRLNPLFASPLRDAGDPATALDPDGSAPDLGALTVRPTDYQLGEVRWTRAGSPWRVTENLTVPAGLTLRIDPGVQVQVAANRRITVNGRLLAQGTAQQRILFSGIPGEIAAGDADPIKNGVQTGAPKWGGLRIVDSMTQENVASHVDFLDAQGTSPLGGENQGSVGFIRSWGLVEYCTWAGTHLRMCYGRNSRMTVRNNVFPDMFVFDPVLNRIENPTDFLASADNSQEPLKVEYPTTDAELVGRADYVNGFPAGGWFRVYYNEFNGNRGHNDVFDADSGRWGVAGHLILDCRYNRFNGLTGDEHIDLGGDAYIASNIFQRGAKDEWTSDTGYSNAISSGDRGTGTTIMVARNYFFDVDHAINLKANTGTIFEHNTVADLNPDFDYTGINLSGNAFTQAVKCAPINVFVPEDGSNPTRGDGGYLGFNLISNVPRLFSGADSRLANGIVVHDVVTKIEFGGNLLHALGSADLSPVRLGGAFNPAFGSNQRGDPRLTADYRPDFGSEALGTARYGLNYGATISEWAYVGNVPEKISTSRSWAFYIGGPGLTAFKWRLNGGPWSAPITIGSGGVFPRTGPTVREALLNLTNLAEGPQLLEVLGQDMAGNWQDNDPAILSGPQAAPTTYSWTIVSQPAVRLNEILANGEPGNPDFIELVNFGGSTNMAGWRLTDDAAQPGYVIPAGTTLANETVLQIPLSQSGIPLDQHGDEVLLYDPSGTLVDRLAFGPQARGYSLSLSGNGATWLLGRPTAGRGNPGQIVQLGNPAAIRISEWFADSDVLFDEDWVELVNPTDLPVSLSGLFLSDHAAIGSQRQALPPHSYIEPGGYAVFRLNEESGRNQLDFALDAEQEALALDFGNTRIDTIVFGPGVRDSSQSRTGTGQPVWNFLPTRGFNLPANDPSLMNAAALLRSLRITQIMYHPAGGNDFEYVELTNTGSTPLNLGGVAFVEGIDFTFPPITLAPGGQTVVVSSLSFFRSRYGVAVPVAGVYSGRLDNAGETLALAVPPPFQGNLLHFRYGADWQFDAQGQGRSLQTRLNATPTSAFDDRLSWQASRVDYGTPAGFQVPAPADYRSWTAFYTLPGGVGTDEDRDGLISLMEFALNSDPLKNVPGQGADRSPALVAGPVGEMALQVSLPQAELGGGYGRVDIRYVLQDSIDLVNWRTLAFKNPADISWTTLTMPTASIITGPAVNSFLPLTLTAPPAPDATKRYLRLQTVLLP